MWWMVRGRIGRWPLYGVFAYYAVAFGVVIYVLDRIVGLSSSVGWAIVSGLAFASLMTPFEGWKRRRDRATSASN